MATRAAIIYLDPKTLTTTSTYNHYDGYPDNLGAALEAYYDDDINAKKIASEGYISYLDLETGEIEVTNPSDRNVKPEITNLTDDEFQSASDIIDLINSYGADYAYIWSPAVDEWVTFKNSDSKTLYMQLEQMMPELLGMGTNPENDPQSGDFINEWKKFLNEDKEIDSAAIDNMWAVYVKSLVNDIKINGVGDYVNFNEYNFIEDFENYVGDKMDY